MKHVIALACLLLLSACEKPNRYELVKVEQGLIRLDRVTGDMVGIADEGAILQIDIPKIENIGPTPARRLGELKLPAGSKTLKVSVVVRWKNGRMDYRIHLSPAVDSLSALNSTNASDVLDILVVDKDGFLIRKLSPVFSFATTTTDHAGRRILSYEGSVGIMRSDYDLIDSVAAQWRFSDAIVAALEGAVEVVP